jgi:hypothetical protein
VLSKGVGIHVRLMLEQLVHPVIISFKKASNPVHDIAQTGKVDLSIPLRGIVVCLPEREKASVLPAMVARHIGSRQSTTAKATTKADSAQAA